MIRFPAFRHRPKPPSTRRTLLRELRKNAWFRSLALRLVGLRLLRPWQGWRIDIECHPEVPGHKYLIWKVALYAGIRLLAYRAEAPRQASKGRARLRLVWLDQTIIEPAVLAQLPMAEWRDALNVGLTDISKRKVEQVFATVFGYALAIDPLTHRGPYVAKSNANAAHDGRVLEGPVAELDPGLVYERLIDNRTDERTVVDYRTPVAGGEIPFVYLKHRPLELRFVDANARVGLARTEEIFSPAERTLIMEFCQAIRLDFGDLDILRDRTSGLIYIVDVNKTGFGPPRAISLADGVRAVRLYAEAIHRCFVAQRRPGRPEA